MWESIDIHSAGHHRGDKVLAGLVLPTPTSLSYFHSRMAHRCRHGVLAGGSGMTNRNSCQPAPNDHIDGPFQHSYQPFFEHVYVGKSGLWM